MYLKKQDIQWITGFYEGEGTCGVYTVNRKYKSLNLAIDQKDKKVLEHIKALTGVGNVITYTSSLKGYCHKWQINAGNAYVFLKMIFPYIRSETKRLQAEKAINAWEKVPHYRYS